MQGPSCGHRLGCWERLPEDTRGRGSQAHARQPRGRRNGVFPVGPAPSNWGISTHQESGYFLSGLNFGPREPLGFAESFPDPGKRCWRALPPGSGEDAWGRGQSRAGGAGPGAAGHRPQPDAHSSEPPPSSPRPLPAPPRPAVRAEVEEGRGPAYPPPSSGASELQWFPHETEVALHACVRIRARHPVPASRAFDEKVSQCSGPPGALPRSARWGRERAPSARGGTVPTG